MLPVPVSTGEMSMIWSHPGVASSKGPEDPLQTLHAADVGCGCGQADLFLLINYNLNFNFAFYSWGPTIKA